MIHIRIIENRYSLIRDIIYVFNRFYPDVRCEVFHNIEAAEQSASHNYCHGWIISDLLPLRECQTRDPIIHHRIVTKRLIQLNENQPIPIFVLSQLVDQKSGITTHQNVTYFEIYQISIFEIVEFIVNRIE